MQAVEVLSDALLLRLLVDVPINLRPPAVVSQRTQLTNQCTIVEAHEVVGQITDGAVMILWRAANRARG